MVKKIIYFVFLLTIVSFLIPSQATAAIKKINESCIAPGDVCETGTFCGATSCSAKRKDGEYCETIDWCTSGLCQNKVCGGKKIELGLPCFADESCKSGMCRQYLCVAGDGKACTDLSHCELGQYCDLQGTKKCTKAKAVGQPCKEAYECQSMNCLETGACEEVKETAEEGQPKTVDNMPNLLGTTDPNVVFGRIITFIVSIAGSFALLIFVYGGVMWLISGGSQVYLKKGKDAMKYATIGLVIIFTSYFLIKLLIVALGVIT